jgi:hypothetical protein
MKKKKEHFILVHILTNEDGLNGLSEFFGFAGYGYGHGNGDGDGGGVSPIWCCWPLPNINTRTIII